MKNKLDLIKEMNRLKVTKITLPLRDVKGCRRPAPVPIDLSNTYEAVLPNYPDDKKGHTSNEAERETHKYTYAELRRMAKSRGWQNLGDGRVYRAPARGLARQCRIPRLGCWWQQETRA